MIKRFLANFPTYIYIILVFIQQQMQTWINEKNIFMGRWMLVTGGCLELACGETLVF